MGDARCFDSCDPKDVIWINQAPVGKRIETVRFFRDHADAAAVSAVAKAVLGRTTNGRVYFSTRGTHVVLEPNPPLLRETGDGEIAQLLGLIPHLNEWMGERAEIIKQSGDSQAQLDASDTAMAAWKLPTLFRTLAGFAEKDGRSLFIAGQDGGGTLMIPPRPLLEPSRKTALSNSREAEEVRGKLLTVKIIDSTGMAYQVARFRVADGLVVGGPARILRPRKTRGGKVARRVRRIHKPGEDKK